MAVAAMDRVAYFSAERLSENIEVSPEGYYICRNAVIGRTGFQTYRVEEIVDPEGLLAERGYKPEEELQLWRDPAEVFSPATLASFEGKDVTLTHPDSLLTPDTVQYHSIGHLQNVRAGTVPLEESGGFPLLADLWLKSREGIDAFQFGARELSCGYLYTLKRTGYRWDQTGIIGNHVALVSKGRAGAEARINDAALAAKESTVNLKSILTGFLRTAKPEEAEAALADKEVMSVLGGGKLSVAMDTAAPAVAAGNVLDEKSLTALAGKKLTVVMDAATNKPTLVVAKDADDAVETESKVASDRRKKMHDALDKQMDAEEEEEKKKKEGDDAAMKDFQTLVDKMAGKGKDAKEDDPEDKKGEDAHPEGCRCGDCMDAKDAEETEKEESETGDSDVVRTEPVLAAGEVPKNALDAAMTMKLLKNLRPFIADTKDKRALRAFDSLFGGIKSAMKPDSQPALSYSILAERTRTVDKDRVDHAKDGLDGGKLKESVSQREARVLEETYAARRTESKDRTLKLMKDK